MVLRLQDEERTTRGLGDLLIETPTGWIPVSQIADVVETDGPNQILRENGKRRLVVLANSDGQTDMAQIVEQIRAVMAEKDLPLGFSRRWKAPFRRRKNQCAPLACYLSCRWR